MSGERHEAFEVSNPRLLYLLIVGAIDRGWFFSQLKVGDWVALSRDKDTGYKIVGFGNNGLLTLQKRYPETSDKNIAVGTEEVCPFNVMLVIVRRERE